MKLYRYLSEEELEKIQAGEIEKIGFFYNDRKKFKRVNNHRYKQNIKYLHFYFDKKEISRIKFARFKGGDVCYVCEFNIPFYVILPYIGIGIYESSGYDVPFERVFEVALPARKMKQKYLINSEKDVNSGPIYFGPIIKFDKRLFYDDVINDKEEMGKKVKLSPEHINSSFVRKEPLSIKVIKKELEESEEMEI